jgi:Carboxypeptidase regulatory-like domain/TonB-dependent Receptor Plug Domain
MYSSIRRSVGFAFILLVSFGSAGLWAQSAGMSGTVSGTITDSTGAVVPGAAITLTNPVSGLNRAAVSDSAGHIQFNNLPFNSYHVSVDATGFAKIAKDVDVRSVVPVNLDTTLQISSTATTVTVSGEGGEDLIQNDSTFQTNVDRSLFEKLPLESTTSSVSSLVTMSTPGISSDSNGLFHGLGDHAENSFSVDGQPITDQQSKVFSNQIPSESIQSMEVISGAPPAEYGDKTSVVIKVTTRSGQGVARPTGSITASYGSFGSPSAGFDLAVGGPKWGNFIAASAMNSGRFLDGPEFSVFHDKGNEENIFDRVDYVFSPVNALHLNLGFTRSWFQTPNSYDNLNIGSTSPITGEPVGATDQKSKIDTFNVAPTYTRVIGSDKVFNLGAFVRKDAYNYYPSSNVFADFTTGSQQETISQHRTLLNTGVRSDFSYVKGINNIKLGATYEQTFLTEHTNLGIVDPGLNAPCIDGNGNPVNGFNDPSQCAAAGYQPNVSGNPNASAPFQPLLGCYDLTRPIPSGTDGCSGPSTIYPFLGHTDVKQLALYLQDSITLRNWSFNVGMRGDLYNGLAIAREAQPRVGIAYSIKQTNTVLRASYARTLETPFNENLVLSATGCDYPVIAALVPCVPSAFNPGFRNEFHVGLEQAFGKYLDASGEYIWKYTHDSYDFSVLGLTPITFPIEWHNSKIPGLAGRISVPQNHGLTAFVVFSSVAARFFPPQIGGLGTTVGQSGYPFRIDHDEKFNSTSHLQYQPFKTGPWLGFNWRYDSGSVAGRVPFATDATTPVDLTILTADQQQQAGLYCGTQRATLTNPLTYCAPAQYGSTLMTIPAPGTQNPDHNPARMAPRSLFDMSLGLDDIFHGDRFKWSGRVTAINATNNFALYNFLSTFSGTHYVSPRSISAEVGFHF